MTGTSTNRFLETRRYYGGRHDVLARPRRGHAWAVPASAADRVLVVLIENGGIDLGLPDLVDKLISEIPGASSVISDSMKAQLVSGLKDWLLKTTDHLIESAELALNRYSATKPDTYGDVVVLRDSTATFGELKNALFTASRAGKVIDLVILTHGRSDYISADNGIDGARIRALAREYGGPLNIRSVYMMNCVGSSLNQAWLDIGARTSAGSHENNYLPEPTTYFFFSAWKDGQTFESAVTGAYRRTVDDMNAALRGLVIGLVPLAGAALAGQIDVSTLSFVVASRPEVVGTGSVTISTDALPPATSGTSTGQSLVTTVVPTRTRALVRTMSVPRTVSPSGRTFIQRWELAGPQLDQRILAVEAFLSDRVATPLTQPQIDALASFGVGIGAPALLRSTLLKMLDAGDLTSIPGEMRKWTKIRRDGKVVEDERLLERRRAEAELFGGGPLSLVAVPASREVREYSYQQNPAAAAIGLAEVVEWGLAAGAIVQSGVQDAAGSFSLTYDDAHRLLTPQGRLGMPGVAAATQSYRRRFLTVPQFRAGTAHATIDLVWSGNAYGEITSVVFERVLTESSEWSKSDLHITVNALSRIPVSKDPREWPITFRYQGTYDPLGNGYVEFQGEIEVNAFGGVRWISPHQAVSRSLSDFLLSGSPEDWVRRGPDVWPATPTIPAEQAAFLRQNVPG
ncbi:MAG TPA: hypothetical protein DEQ43_26045 [Nocardioides bacterium]|nr:hypothetical protein [Nocardioides sp.]